MKRSLTATARTAALALCLLGALPPAALAAGQSASAAEDFVIAPGSTPVIGHGGRLLRFRVAVERSIAEPTPAAFAADVMRILGDPRSWTWGGKWRFQRVGAKGNADFTIYLATPVTRDRLCQEGYDRYTSCRDGDRVVINIDRWRDGVPDYGAALAVYREYVINHEVGHELGYGHELCPGPGKLAPTMEQQTLGLHGCIANPWPYPDGSFYAGPPGVYHDPIPGVEQTKAGQSQG
ncbi:MAG TPA: DUF3152 domain-containing protein [Gammaproteobacteria bacterium]|nr:DUF3152 domain-containing protein [Gammaproteobacteria bacterium]